MKARTCLNCGKRWECPRYSYFPCESHMTDREYAELIKALIEANLKTQPKEDLMADKEVYVVLFDEEGHERDHYSLVKVFDNKIAASEFMDHVHDNGGVFTYSKEKVFSKYGED